MVMVCDHAPPCGCAPLSPMSKIISLCDLIATRGGYSPYSLDRASFPSIVGTETPQCKTHAH